ncbi:MAG: hypothetical protein M0008_12875 [Actinomycetota bacterium]|nr:hypothetical protein [Actinomycetota bacterium]
MDDTTSRWEPESDQEYEAACTELRRRFAAWATRGDAVFDPDAPEGLLHYKCGFVDGHLTRWTRRDLDEIYLELNPAKVMAEPDELLAEAAMFLIFLLEHGTRCLLLLSDRCMLPIMASTTKYRPAMTMWCPPMRP